MEQLDGSNAQGIQTISELYRHFADRAQALYDQLFVAVDMPLKARILRLTGYCVFQVVTSESEIPLLDTQTLTTRSVLPDAMYVANIPRFPITFWTGLERLPKSYNAVFNSTDTTGRLGARTREYTPDTEYTLHASDFCLKNAVHALTTRIEDIESIVGGHPFELRAWELTSR